MDEASGFCALKGKGCVPDAMKKEVRRENIEVSEREEVGHG